MKRISIVVPVYNIENYIRGCLESIKRQSFTDFVCYVVNDGTKDNSVEIIKEFLDDKRFVLLNKDNGGLSDARNYGLGFVKTKYVMFVDGDDSLEDDCLEKALNKLEETNSDLVMFAYNQHYLANGKKEIISIDHNKETTSLKETKKLLFTTPNAAWNKVYKTSLFIDNDIKYPLGKRYEDLGTTPKLLLLANSISYIDEPLYNYSIDRPNNISTQIDEKLYHIFDMCKEIIEFYKENGKFEEYKHELDCLVSRNLISTLRKVITMSDRKFVFDFIDFTFDFKELNFGKFKNKYNIANTKDDKIYLNRYLCKLYYLYKKV